MTSMIDEPFQQRIAGAFETGAPLALFLDFDGTLVEIAPVPSSVKVDRRLSPALDRLRGGLGGALALVSGRPIGFLDDMFAPHRFDAAGLHGSQIRLGETTIDQAQAPAQLQEATRELVRFANSQVGIIVEDKGLSVALHWRMAPQLEDQALALARGLALQMGPSVRLQEGKAVAELVPASVSKGLAIGWMMERAPFSGRRPVFIGDDVTDEAGFEEVNRLGGLSIRIGEGDSCAQRRLASPTELRSLLLGAAERGSLDLADFTPRHN